MAYPRVSPKAQIKLSPRENRRPEESNTSPFTPDTELSINCPLPWPSLGSGALMDRVLNALDRKLPCSIISVGATEAFVMAQYTLFAEEEFMCHPEALIANQGIRSGFHHRGIRFPNIKARDEAIDAVRKADIIGYNTMVESARNLTESVFRACDIQPRLVFEANLRRVLMFSQKEKFMDMLRGRRIILVGSLAPRARLALEQNYQSILEFEIVTALPIYEYEEVPWIKEQIARHEFDLCLLAAGINAVILAPFVAESLGRVAFDIGSGMQSIYTGEIVTDAWLAYVIGITRLLSM